MNQKGHCRHLSANDLYRTILLEEGCDLGAPRKVLPTPTFVWNHPMSSSADANRWLPRLQVWFGDSYGS